ncbi:MAG: RNase adapter RapZ, partial [Longimicrobiales bacterium]|nr:RNase adapter RapZ [Longimicrobiales bacterium]
DTDHFLYRDFQSRNIMLREGEPWLIDYQGGRRGALHYDPASLLYDAKAAIPEPVRDALLEHYLDALEEVIDVDRADFRHRYRGYVVVRMLQAMGAYGYRGFHEGKPRFLQSVPHAARNLELLLDRGLPVAMPEVEAVFRRIIDRWADWSPGQVRDGGLTVRITSFSYRGGYPRDLDPHGGGFVFDCRALPNPGRLPAYEYESGLDSGTAEFLDRRDETRHFWTGVRQLADAQIEEYLRRGFTSLAISFGCTGGQHRSVYMAERLAAHIREAFPRVEVRVAHREHEQWPPGATRPAGRPG